MKIKTKHITFAITIAVVLSSALMKPDKEVFLIQTQIDSFVKASSSGPSPAGGGHWCPAPHLKSVRPNFMFGTPVAAYIQYCIKNYGPPCGF